MPEDSMKDTFILANSTIAKNANLDDLRRLLSTVCKNTTNSKTKFNKASTSVKQLVVEGVSYCSTNN